MLHTFILLDRSGSMTIHWAETLGALNAYVQELDKESRVTLAAFDAVAETVFDIVRDTTVAEFKPLTNTDILPRGNTPLYDAIGRLSTLVNQANVDKTVVVILTDGAENHSVELNKQQAKAIIEGFKAKNWPVVFLGANFDVFAEATNIGLRGSSTLNMTRGNYTDAFIDLGAKTMAYAVSGNLATMYFNNEDRLRATKNNS